MAGRTRVYQSALGRMLIQINARTDTHWAALNILLREWSNQCVDFGCLRSQP